VPSSWAQLHFHFSTSSPPSGTGGRGMGVAVSSSHVVSATPSSSGGGLLTLCPCSSVRSLSGETVLHKILQRESFPRAAALHKLPQHGSFPRGACLPVVFITGFRGKISVLASGASLPPPSSLTLVSAELFLSHSLTPLSRLPF